MLLSDILEWFCVLRREFGKGEESLGGNPPSTLEASLGGLCAHLARLLGGTRVTPHSRVGQGAAGDLSGDLTPT